MNLLLDTHAFLWLLLDDPALSSRARQELLSAENSVWLSAASVWEIAVKYGLGKLPLPAAPDFYIPEMRQRSGIDLLPIGEAEACQMHKLPPIHRDPFDRMLIAQAHCHGMVIVTDDAMIGRYPVGSFW